MLSDGGTSHLGCFGALENMADLKRRMVVAVMVEVDRIECCLESERQNAQ